MPTDTDLHKAANSGDLAALEAIFDNPEDQDEPPDVNVAGAGERRPIHRAAGANHREIIKYLIGKGALVDQVDKSQRTALHWAALGGCVEGGQVLVEAGADLFAVTTSKTTTLHASAEAGKAPFVEFLIGCAGDRKQELFTALDADNKSAFDLAMAAKHKAVINSLRNAGDPKAASAACTVS